MSTPTNEARSRLQTQSPAEGTTTDWTDEQIDAVWGRYDQGYDTRRALIGRILAAAQAPAPAQGIDTTALRELADAALISAMKDGRHPNAKNNEALGIARQDLFAAIGRLGAPQAPAVGAEPCAICGEGKALLMRCCNHCGSEYAGSAEMMENYRALAVGAGQWVPVGERLPDKNVEVLVAFRGISIPATGQYTGSSKDRDTNGWCYPAENNGTCDDGSDPVVTHWMPLPAAPDSNVPVQGNGNG